MKKTEKRRTRLFAVCVCLIVVLSACASAPSGESKETSAHELSELNAESTSSEAEPSEESGENESSAPDEHISADSDATLSEDITITPIEPTYPEERETTLELVKEYPLGEGGIPFYLLYENDPTIADIVVAWFLADENGNIYAYNGERFYDLQNKTSFVPPRGERLIAREIAIGKSLYCLTLDGILNIYNAQGENTNSIQYPKRSENGTYDLFAALDGTLRVVVDGTFYDASGKKIASEYVLDSVNQKADMLSLLGREYLYSNDLYVKCYADEILTAYESQHHTVYTDGLAEIDECLIYQYDKSGDPLSEFMIYRFDQSERIPCNIIYEDVVCKSFTPCSIVVGKQRFDNLIDANWFVGADGTIYLMLINPEGGKLYKINPGYSDVTFTDYEASLPGDTPIEPVIPEERETTLEKVLSFDIGIDGLFQYRMLYYDDPSIADIEVPGEILICGDGKFYHMVANSPMQHAISLYDGTSLELNTGNQLGRIWIYEDRLYTKMGDILYEYNVANGLDSATLISQSECEKMFICETAGGKLYLCSEDGQLYTMKGKAVGETFRNYVYSDQNLADNALVVKSDTVQWVVDREKASVVAATDELLLVKEKNTQSVRGTILYVYSWYDQSGKLVSRLAYKQLKRDMLACEVDFDLRGTVGTVKEYRARDVYIGKAVFENVLWEKMFFDSNGMPYLAIYYTDHCEIYRVNAGYTSAEF